MDESQFREAATAAVDEVIKYFSSLSSLPVVPPHAPNSLAPLLPSAAPDRPQPFADILADLDAHVLPRLTHWQHPRFMAFFPAHSTYPSILGELFSAAFNAPAFNWLCSPACTELEGVVMEWLGKFLGLPESFWSTGGAGGGVIQGSASEAVLAAMIAARERAVARALEAEGLAQRAGESAEEALRREDRAAEVRGNLVALSSECAHSSPQKAANMAGVRFRAVAAPGAEGFRMTGAALAAKLREVREQGLTPFFVAATLGTTGTCAVDPLGEVVAACEAEAGEDEVWVHVDAAYAGSALCCEEFRWAAEGMERVDSFNMNMHKWMLVNFDASCLFLRRRAPLVTAMSISPSYLLNPSTLSGQVTDYRDWQIPLGRRFRALKIWFVLRSYGTDAIRAMIRRHVALGELFAATVADGGDGNGCKGALEIVSGPAFALTVVRCTFPPPPANGRPGGSSSGPDGASAPTVAPAAGGVDGNKADEMNSFGSSPDAATNREGTPATATATASTTTTTTTTTVQEREDALTREVCELVNSRGEFFVTGTVLDGRYCIRVVSANERANEGDVRRAARVLAATTREVAASKEKQGNGGV